MLRRTEHGVVVRILLRSILPSSHVCTPYSVLVRKANPERKGSAVGPAPVTILYSVRSVPGPT